MVYLRALERERELKEEGREEGIREAESHFEPIIKQKDDMIEQKDSEIARLKSLLTANGISETR